MKTAVALLHNHSLSDCTKLATTSREIKSSTSKGKRKKQTNNLFGCCRVSGFSSFHFAFKALILISVAFFVELVAKENVPSLPVYRSR